MQVVLAGVLWSWCYHFLNGIRHLCWDAGVGFERGVARASGWVVAIASLVLTALLWLVLRSGPGGAV
jgi:succinate dehydrogenase / fumarate reductase cytochrome b subunit